MEMRYPYELPALIVTVLIFVCVKAGYHLCVTVSEMVKAGMRKSNPITLPAIAARIIIPELKRKPPLVKRMLQQFINNASCCLSYTPIFYITHFKMI